MFKFFDKTNEIPHVHNFRYNYQIACAIINYYLPPVAMRGANAQLTREHLFIKSTRNQGRSCPK